MTEQPGVTPHETELRRGVDGVHQLLVSTYSDLQSAYDQFVRQEMTPSQLRDILAEKAQPLWQFMTDQIRNIAHVGQTYKEGGRIIGFEYVSEDHVYKAGYGLQARKLRMYLSKVEDGEGGLFETRGTFTLPLSEKDQAENLTPQAVLTILSQDRAVEATSFMIGPYQGQHVRSAVKMTFSPYMPSLEASRETEVAYLPTREESNFSHGNKRSTESFNIRLDMRHENS